jgi:phosphatidylglycerol---prolipoprotein diacylglyceryl transferase
VVGTLKFLSMSSPRGIVLSFSAASMMSVLFIKIGLDPVLIQFGPVSVHWYGLMYVVGIAVGLYVALPYAERHGIPRDRAYEVFWPVLIACLIGGRLYYVVQSNLGWYLRHPQNILATWEGGMAFYGAVFLGIPALFLAARRVDVSVPKLLDATALFIPVAQSFGRVGNLVNGDIVGYPSSAPWATQYTNPNNTFVPSHLIAYAPAAFLELVFSAALFVFLWTLKDRFRVPGTLFAVWLSIYSVGQFVLFFARANTVVALGLKQAQWTALIVLLITIPSWVVWRRFVQREPRVSLLPPDRAPEDGRLTIPSSGPAGQ